MTSSTPIIPVYRGLTFVGKVLDKNVHGEVHVCHVTTTTVPDEVEVVYDLRRS